jgi:hypothetical protein
MNTHQTNVNYNLIKSQIGTVVVDTNFRQYVVSDYKLGCDAYQLWDKKEQKYYYTDYNAFNALYTQISG